MSNHSYQEIAVNLLIPFANHPFKLYDDHRLDDMEESIRANGVHTPIIVRPAPSDEGKYEILSGHNRTEAAKKVGVETVPTIVRKGLTDDEAMFVVTETNLIQRSFTDMLHSEKSVVIAVHYEAIKKKQGYRSDLLESIEGTGATGEQVAPKLKSADKIGEQYSLSADTIKRYLRVNKLIQPLKERLDNDCFGIVAAVALSYLNEKEQQIVDKVLGESGKIGIGQAKRLRRESETAKLGISSVREILHPEKPLKAVKPFKIKTEIVSEYFVNGESDDEIENVIAEALRAYFKK